MATDLQEAPVRTLSPERRVVLHCVPWEIYQQLRDEEANWGLRMTYDQGELEIMSPSPSHECYAELLGQLVRVVAEECNIPLRSFRSTTWKEFELEKGLEADNCFYIKNAPIIGGRKDIDLDHDPPPDLAIEIEITSAVVKKIAIYQALGVPELWRCDGEDLRTFRLDESGEYVEQQESLNLPFLPLAEVMAQVHRLFADDLDETAWSRGVRKWVRETVAPNA